MLGLALLWFACSGPRAEAPDDDVEAAIDPAPSPPPQKKGIRLKQGDGAWFVVSSVIHSHTPTADKFGVPDGGREPRGGEAVAVFDADGDWRQDIVIVNGSDYFIPAKNWEDPTWRAVLWPAAQLDGTVEDNVSNRAKGLGVHDLNNDGALDLYLANQGAGGLITYKRDPPGDRGLYRSPSNSTWINTKGVFSPVPMGIDAAGAKRTALFEDFDGDGFTDAYVSASSYWGIWYAGGTEPNQMFPGLPDNTFGPDMLDAFFDGPMTPFWTDEAGRSVKNFKAALVRDLDKDGLPDIITGSIADLWANYELDLCDPAEPGYQGGWQRGLYIFQNKSKPGAIRMTDVTSTAYPGGYGTDGQGHVHSIVALDIDHDADLDLVVSGNRGRLSHDTEARMSPILRVLRNDSTPGDIRLTDVTEASGLGFLNRIDALPAPYPIRTTLYGVDITLYPALMAAVPVDVDNDGNVDVVAVDRQTFSEDPVSGQVYGLGAWLFLGDGKGGFRFVPVEQHGLAGTARDVSTGDFDADGRADLVFVDGSAGGQAVSNENRVWLNEIDNWNHWLAVSVDEPRNRFGVGARVTVREAGTDRVLAYDEVRTDFNYRSKRDALVQIGTGEVKRVDIQVDFRDGAMAVWRDQPVDQRVHVIRDELQQREGRWMMAGSERVWVGGVLRWAVERDSKRLPMGVRRDLDGDTDIDMALPEDFVPGGMIAAPGREGYLFVFDAWNTR